LARGRSRPNILFFTGQVCVSGGAVGVLHLLTVLRSKNGRPRHIPLSAVAVAILRRQA